ncbi:MAG: TlpA family protein disulfide reductase [Rhodoferax sp.]|nr:TlpA family protein disulfide reductase [Rhodoferax sp.]
MTTPERESPPPGQHPQPAAEAARRRWLFAAVAGTAAAAGAGLWWWQARPGGGSPGQAHPIWNMEFPTHGGATLSMRSFTGRPLLLNFWATWCPPCIEEMPLLDRFYAENHANGWQVLGLAVDQGAAVTRFLTQTPVQFPVALAGMAGVELSRSLGNQGGGLPFTVVFDGTGQVAQRKIGRVDPQDLQEWRGMR